MVVQKALNKSHFITIPFIYDSKMGNYRCFEISVTYHVALNL